MWLKFESNRSSKFREKFVTALKKVILRKTCLKFLLRKKYEKTVFWSFSADLLVGSVSSSKECWFPSNFRFFVLILRVWFDLEPLQSRWRFIFVQNRWILVCGARSLKSSITYNKNTRIWKFDTTFLRLFAIKIRRKFKVDFLKILYENIPLRCVDILNQSNT